MDEDLKDKIDALEKENKYLKKLLRENNIDFEYPREVETCKLNSSEKIELFLSYFNGREDIFAYQYINKEGKKSCYPVCKYKTNTYPYCEKNKKCSSCEIKDYRGITDNDVINHLKGTNTYGVYPLLNENKTMFLAFDFDDEDFKNSALTFSKICKRCDLDVLVEISQSGSGAHVWMFFETAIKANKARKLGTHLLSIAMNESKHIDFSSFDRMFPSQDSLPKDKKYGNLIILPLQGTKAREGKTIFVDENFIPYELDQQFSVLKSTRKITEVEIDYLLEKFKDEDALGLFPKNVLKNLKLDKTDFPKTLCIVKNNEIVVSKAGMTNKAIKFLYRLGSVANPEYYELVKRKQMVYAYGNIRYPMVKRLYKEDESFVYLPRGCEDNLIKVLNYLNTDYQIEDKQTIGSMISATFLGSLREEQNTALNQLIKYDNGIFVAPPAFGKTVVAIALISKLCVNTLIVVPKLSLIDQWRERLDSFLSIGYSDYKKEKDKYGTYTGSKKKLTNYIDIASIDSLTSEEGKEILKNYGMVIFDEVHHVGALTYEEVARSCQSKYLYGFTATPKRSDDNHTIVFKTIGDIRYEYKDVIHSEFVRLLTPKFTHFTFTSEQLTLPFVDQITLLLKDEDRNELITKELISKHKSNKNILLLTDRIEHIKLLSDKLKEKGIENILSISGENSKNEKEQFLYELENLNDGFIVLSTGKYIGEGFDQSKFDTLFIVSPFRWKGTLSQYVGRLHRIRKGKTSVEVVDFIDVKVGVFSSMYHERLSGYKKEKYMLLTDDGFYQKQIYSLYEYEESLNTDLKSCKNETVMVVNDYDENKLKTLMSLCNDKLILYSSKEVEGLITKQTDFKTNIIIIDKKIVWYGGINPYTNFQFGSDIMRIEDKAVADDLLKDICK